MEGLKMAMLVYLAAASVSEHNCATDPSQKWVRLTLEVVGRILIPIHDEIDEV